MVTPPERKVMVVADPTPHSAAALQYALSHAMLEQDELILFHVENPNSWKNTFSTFLRKPSFSSASTAPSATEGASTDIDFLDQMKRACEIAQPNIPVRIEKTDMDGKDKATVILSKCKALGIDLLIIGQRRSLSSAILGYKRSSGSMRGAKLIDTADYLIENSQCTCVGVQKRGQNGGYVLNTKTHKNFWLLA
ncbi:hypothetical protein QUC31_016395 [Theobroma cacao]|uniref:Uncharacterized protein LOC18603330 n=2 Tax=Theobroma cacao TaxID=3641 RepID=A0AB32VAD3_THECC|nr:PREDICTED: uncharacterized protein LOC18603330 [Theobroma cacao]EOY06221.1 Adenine nucleotide alpha hydrolases-like superfamily protein, putative [Theobroma cacao]WRX19892.1 UspA - like 10 [Theobroma cacao]